MKAGGWEFPEEVSRTRIEMSDIVSNAAQHNQRPNRCAGQHNRENLHSNLPKVCQNEGHGCDSRVVIITEHLKPQEGSVWRSK